MFISVCCDVHLFRDVYCMLFFSVRLADYEIIRGASRDPAGVHICDLSQNATYTRKTHQRMFCFLRNSQPWLMNQDLPFILVCHMLLHYLTTTVHSTGPGYEMYEMFYLL